MKVTLLVARGRHFYWEKCQTSCFCMTVSIATYCKCYTNGCTFWRTKPFKNLCSTWSWSLSNLYKLYVYALKSLQSILFHSLIHSVHTIRAFCYVSNASDPLGRFGCRHASTIKILMNPTLLYYCARSALMNKTWSLYWSNSTHFLTSF